MSAAVKVPHVHAEAIHAFADGEQIECRPHCDTFWAADTEPKFHVLFEYRVKPTPPVHTYPATGMTFDQIMKVVRETPGQFDESYFAIANAALRHACDAGAILTLADHQAAIAAFGEKLRDAASGREMAISEAVRGACSNICDGYSFAAQRQVDSIDLAAIIAKVPTC